MLLVDDHALSTDSVFLGSGAVALITAFTGDTGGIVLHAGLLADDVEHGVLEGLLVLGQTVLLPRVVEDAWVKVVALHAALEVVQAGAIVGLLLELERPAVLHVLAELSRVTAAELLERRLDLLLLDVVVLLVLGATWQTLPWQLALQQVQ